MRERDSGSDPRCPQVPRENLKGGRPTLKIVRPTLKGHRRVMKMVSQSFHAQRSSLSRIDQITSDCQDLHPDPQSSLTPNPEVDESAFRVKKGNFRTELRLSRLTLLKGGRVNGSHASNRARQRRKQPAKLLDQVRWPRSIVCHTFGRRGDGLCS